MYPQQATRLRSCGAPELASFIDALQLEEYERDMPLGYPDAWLEDGQQLAVGDRILEVYHTPGHTRGHMIVTDPNRDMTITGITSFLKSPPPSDSSAPQRCYRWPPPSSSIPLTRVKSLPNAQMLPAHGQVTPHVHDRVDALLAHHSERLDAVVSQIPSGRHTTTDIAGALPWTRHQRALTDLSEIHQMTAILEIAAHLDVSAIQGRVQRTALSGVDHFDCEP